MRLILIFGCWILLACNKKNAAEQVATDSLAKGADIGWLSEMESKGVRFYNAKGEQQDCIDILKQLGINSIRLRVWVNPVNGWCGKEDVVNQAVRASQKGMRIMIDFHYADYWADPGKQNKPASWKSLSIAELQNAVANHTRDILLALKNRQVHPEWVQVGNEINDGFLWEDGRASKNMVQFTSLVKSGCAAVKEIFPNTKVVIHISNGYDNALFRWIFDGLTANGANWDVIGMSLYPEVANWITRNDQCLFNMIDMVNRYGKEVIISEVGMPVNQATICKQFITDLIAKTRSVPGNKGLGVFYWEPQCYNGWQGYQMGAFDDSGKPTAALDAFR